MTLADTFLLGDYGADWMIDDSWYVRPHAVPERVGAGGVVVRVEAGKLLVALVTECIRKMFRM